MSITNVAIYVRVSTDRQAKKGDSIDEQLSTCKAYIASKENMVLAGTYIDDGISGRKIKRGDFEQLLDDVRLGRVNLIIFTKLDRWFRTLINPDISLEDEGVNQMKMLYSSCPPEMRDTLLHHTQETVKELTELSEIFEMN